MITIILPSTAARLDLIFKDKLLASDIVVGLDVGLDVGLEVGPSVP